MIDWFSVQVALLVLGFSLLFGVFAVLGYVAWRDEEE